MSESYLYEAIDPVRLIAEVLCVDLVVPVAGFVEEEG